MGSTGRDEWGGARVNGDPYEPSGPDPAADEFEAIVAGWRREGAVPAWPGDDRPSTEPPRTPPFAVPPVDATPAAPPPAAPPAVRRPPRRGPPRRPRTSAAGARAGAVRALRPTRATPAPPD